ncbi:MAG TPA: hypothetical protein EYG86_05605 [Crocinitomicaceae bacterium]|nr:hypothetical protein [Crocinitomicaceae bacterium]
MRIIYFLMKLFLTYPLSIYYTRRKMVNSPKQLFGRTIYVSNHASSFMDPLIVAGFNRPSVFFMTRSDVFTKFSKPFLWAAQMLPIYRQLDGKDATKKNEAVFDSCARILSFGRNLLIFGEGFTDDTFIRRLKPVKKGAVKIGFIAMEKMNWKKKVYICAVGVNYSDPKAMRSDLLISYSDKICLNDYRSEYEKIPAKVITDLTRKIELLMQEQLTDNRKLELAPMHENILKITRKGMNLRNFDRRISLVNRWKYSKKLATWLNSDERNQEQLLALKTRLEEYNNSLEKATISEYLLFWKKENPRGSRSKELLYLIFMAPLALIGAVHAGWQYVWVKKLTEKTMKRPVFWSSVKMFLGVILIAFSNMALLGILYTVLDLGISGWWYWLYFFLVIGITAPIFYDWITALKLYKEKGRVNELNLEKVMAERKKVEKEVEAFLSNM